MKHIPTARYRHPRSEKKLQGSGPICVHVYLPRETYEEVDAEGRRLDRSISWVFREAWKIARPAIVSLPSTGLEMSP